MKRIAFYLGFCAAAFYFVWACGAHEPTTQAPAGGQTALFPSLQWTPSVTYQAVPLNIAPYSQQLQLGTAPQYQPPQQYQTPQYQTPQYRQEPIQQPSYRTDLSVRAPGFAMDLGGYPPAYPPQIYAPQASAVPLRAQLYRRAYWTPFRNLFFGRYRIGLVP